MTDLADGAASDASTREYTPVGGEEVRATMLFEAGGGQTTVSEVVIDDEVRWLVSEEGGPQKVAESVDSDVFLNQISSKSLIADPVVVPAEDGEDDVWVITATPSRNYNLQRIVPAEGSKIPIETNPHALEAFGCSRAIAIPSTDDGHRALLACRNGYNGDHFFTLKLDSEQESVTLKPLRRANGETLNQGKEVGALVLAVGDIDHNGTTDIVIISDSYSIPPYRTQPANWDGAILLRCPPGSEQCGEGQRYVTRHIYRYFGHGGYMAITPFRLDNEAFPNQELRGKTVYMFSDVGAHHSLYCENMLCWPVGERGESALVADRGPEELYANRGGGGCESNGRVLPTHWGMANVYANKHACDEKGCVSDMVPDMLVTAAEFGSVGDYINSTPDEINLKTGDDTNYLSITGGSTCGPGCGIATNYKTRTGSGWKSSTYCNHGVVGECEESCPTGDVDCNYVCESEYIGEFGGYGVELTDRIEPNGRPELIYGSDRGGLRVEELEGAHEVCTVIVNSRYGFDAGGANLAVEQAFPSEKSFGSPGWDQLISGGAMYLTKTRAVTALAGQGRIRFPSGYTESYDCEPGETVDVSEPDWISVERSELVLETPAALNGVEFLVVSNPHGSDAQRHRLSCRKHGSAGNVRCDLPSELRSGMPFQIGYTQPSLGFPRWIEHEFRAP